MIKGDFHVVEYLGRYLCDTVPVVEYLGTSNVLYSSTYLGTCMVL